MTQALSSDDPFKTLNRIQSVPFTVEGETYRPIPLLIKNWFSPWTVQQEECFYDEKTATLLKSAHLNHNLWKIALTISIISTPILFKKAIGLPMAIIILACEGLGMYLLHRRARSLLLRCCETIDVHFKTINSELIGLIKKGREILGSDNPSSEELEKLPTICPDFDKKLGMMFENFSSRSFITNKDKKAELLSLSKQSSEALNQMRSVLHLFNNMDEAVGAEEKEIVSSFQKLLVKTKCSLITELSEIFNKALKKIEQKFQRALKQGHPLDTIKSEALHLHENLDALIQFADLLKYLFQVENKKEPDKEKLKKSLAFFANFDTANIPDDIEHFSQILLNVGQQKATSYNQETWIISINDPSPVPIFRPAKLDIIRRYILFKPDNIAGQEFWSQQVPELFIALSIFLKNNPDSIYAPDASLLIAQFTNLDIGPAYFSALATNLLKESQALSPENGWKFYYYYRLYVLKEQCKYYIDEQLA